MGVQAIGHMVPSRPGSLCRGGARWQSTPPVENNLVLSSTSVWFFQFPRQNRERPGQQLNLPVHRRLGKRRSPKVQSSTRPEIEPGTFCLIVRDCTNCANLQSQTITLDNGFLFPRTPCPMLFCRFKNISKEKSTSL